MSYIKSFKKFLKNDETNAKKVGANPLKVEEDEAALLTDPKLVATEDQIRALEKQLEAAKQQKETIVKDLRAKAATQKQQEAQPAAQTPAPTTPTT